MNSPRLIRAASILLLALLAACGRSAPIDGKATPADMTVIVHLPAGTPAADIIYIAGNFQAPSQWDPGADALTRDGDTARGQITVPPGYSLEFKITRGSWDKVEVDAHCVQIANRTATGAAGATLEVTVENWADLCTAVNPGAGGADPRALKVTLAQSALGVPREFYVYLPPGYNAARKPGYPTVYFFRGHEAEWITPGEDGTRGPTDVLDVYETLLAAGQVEPMILVFPGISSADNSVSGLLTDFLHPELVPEASQPSVGSGAWESYLTGDLIPYVDSHYDVSGARGVDGFSLGGFMAAKIALQHPELFTSVGVFDGTYLYADATCDGISPQDTLFYSPDNDWLYAPAFGPLPRDGAYAARNNAPNLACKADPLRFAQQHWFVEYGAASCEPTCSNYLRGEHFMQQLAKAGIRNELPTAIREGGHNWKNADEHARTTLPLHSQRLTGR